MSATGKSRAEIFSTSSQATLMPRPAQVHGRRARQAGGDGELSTPTTLRGGRQRSEGSCGVEVCVRRAVRLTAQLLAVTDVHLDAGELLGEVRQAAHHVAVTRADLAERAARLRVTTQSLPPLAPGCVANAKAALKQQRAARPDDPRNDRRLSGEAGRRLHLAWCQLRPEEIGHDERRADRVEVRWLKALERVAHAVPGLPAGPVRRLGGRRHRQLDQGRRHRPREHVALTTKV